MSDLTARLQEIATDAKAWPFAEARALADEKLRAVLAMTEDPANNLALAKTAEDLVAAHEQGKGALILGFQNARILGTAVSGLDAFYDLGVRVFALTHMGHNDFADSSRPVFDGATGQHEAVAEHGGLSALGKNAVTSINALGGIIDISQLSKAAALQVLALSDAPVIASHSNVWQLSNVSRNLSDEEIDRIGESGGVIHVAPFRGYLFDSSDETLDQAIRAARQVAGITEDFYYPFELYWEIQDEAVQQKFLSTVSDLLGPGSIGDVIDHIDYIVSRIGVDHVGIGGDLDGIDSTPTGLEGVETYPALIAELLALGVSAGQTVELGERSFVVEQAITLEPDRGTGFVNFAEVLIGCIARKHISQPRLNADPDQSQSS